jgi:hypothetical protein
MVGLHLPNAIGKTEEIIPRRASPRIIIIPTKSYFKTNASEIVLSPFYYNCNLWHAKRVLVTKIIKLDYLLTYNLASLSGPNSARAREPN